MFRPLKEANKFLEPALSGMKLNLRYRKGPIDFLSFGVRAASDAGFAGESGSKSQGRIHFLVPAEQVLKLQNCDHEVMIVSFWSTTDRTIKRVCGATLQAETYAQNAKEAGSTIRAFTGRIIRVWECRL